jgi:hypothetical protein
LNVQRLNVGGRKKEKEKRRKGEKEKVVGKSEI